MTGKHSPLPEKKAAEKKNQTNEQQAEKAEAEPELVGVPPTCLEIIDALEVANEEVARDDNGGVSQHVDQEAEEPEIVPAVQQW